MATYTRTASLPNSGAVEAPDWYAIMYTSFAMEQTSESTPSRLVLDLGDHYIVLSGSNIGHPSGNRFEGTIASIQRYDKNMNLLDTISGSPQVATYQPLGVIIGQMLNGADTMTGGALGEKLLGLAGADTIHGGGGDDLLYGESDDAFHPSDPAGDHLYGDAGDDTLIPGGGDDFLDGGSGIDTAYFSGSIADFDIQVSADGMSAVVTDLRADRPEGQDHLVNVERLYFSDAPYSVVLFDAAANDVDFENLDAAHAKMAALTAAHYALGGNDNVYLPGVSQALALGFDTTIRFDAGAGDDTVTGRGADDYILGGLGSDRLDGGAGNDLIRAGLDDDILVGSSGRDALYGDDGNDTFDFQASGFASWTAGTVQTVNGGSNAGGEASSNGGIDLIKLPGGADEYQMAVAFGPDWSTTKTSIGFGPVVGPPMYTLDSRDIEKAVFRNPVTTVVATATTASDMIVEMARLSNEVYGRPDDGKHLKEDLANDPPSLDPRLTYFDFAAAAVQRGWHAISALELGIKPADFGAFGALRYTFVGGAYSAYDSGQTSLPGLGGDIPEANAEVLSGIVNGQRTLTIAFRGTDQFADFADYLQFSNHLAKFKPLLDAVRDFTKDPANGIQQILLTGHSLGAGMVQLLMRQDGFNGQNVKAFTFGSPGTDAAIGGDVRIENFIHTDDLVPLFGESISLAGGTAIKAAVQAGLASLVGPLAASLLVNLAQAKLRVGTDVRFDSFVSDRFGSDEHSMSLYLETLVNLAQRAGDAASPFHGLPALAAFRAGNPNFGIDYELSVGSDQSNVLVDGSERALSIPTVGYSDQVMLAGGGNDSLQTGFSSNLLGLPDSFWKIDGGEGKDNLLIDHLDHAQFDKTPFGTGYKFDYYPVPLVAHEFAEVYRVEFVVLPDSTDGVVVEKLGGAPLNVQHHGGANAFAAAAAAPTFVVDPSFDYADAGDGALKVIGSGEPDIILLGSGDKTVDGGDGADIVIAKADASLASDVLTLNGNAGDDFLKGGKGGDFIDGGIDNDRLRGEAGADTLVGGLGNDDLDGGSNPELGQPGAQGDVMLGGAGDDTYHVDSGLDLVDEGGYFPDFGFGGIDTIISTTDFYWDVASVGETDIVAEDVVDAGGDGVTIVGGVFDNMLIGHSGTDVLFGRGGNDTYRAGDGVDFISLSTLGVPDTDNYTADGNNIVIVDPRTSGPFSYDIVFEFDPAKDKIDVSNYTGAHDYTSGAQVLSHAADDGAGNCYIVLGDGLDYLYIVGLEKAALTEGDFMV